MKPNLTKVLRSELQKRNNPEDLKPSIVALVVALSPVTVSIDNGNSLLVEGEELEISEQFRLRCNIDKTNALSSIVPDNCTNAKAVTETHSAGGAPCNMPSAISYLATAILAIKDELLALKCDLKIGDYVAIASLEAKNKYKLIDKIINEGV